MHGELVPSVVRRNVAILRRQPQSSIFSAGMTRQKKRYRFVILLDAVDELKEKHRQRQLAVTNRLDRWGKATIVLFSARTEMSTGCGCLLHCQE